MPNSTLVLGLVAVAATAGAALLAFADITPEALLMLGVGVLGFVWFAVLLTVPWNVYFQARRVVREARTSRERGIEVSAGNETEARRIARRVRTAAIGAHVVTAAATAVTTYFWGETFGYYISGLFLLSTLFRPAQAWFVHLRGRLGTMLQEVHHPRDDVLALIERVAFLEARAEAARLAVEQLHQADHTLDQRLEAVGTTASRSSDELSRRIEALGRRFEDAVSRLTDDQEVITGIKAFLRLLRTDPA
ncbi:hypothetical protein [Actinomadura sediminis]|uniref:Histidine kinase n=1 Tax=Actinomadura sediminis TaxID=1038904 RepID=A0ABW3EH74_9ACTN